MRSVVLRSVCCGVAAVLVSAWFYVSALVWYASRNAQAIPHSETGKVMVPGWEVMPLMRNAPVVTSAWFVGAFAIGFWFGYRYFAKRSSPQTI